MSSSGRAAPSSVTLPKKPMARATRVALFEREVRERLSEPALELLLASARVLTEGQLAPAPSGGQAFFGTTMVTVDLRGADGKVRERCDARAARHAADLLAADSRLLQRVRAIAEQEVSRLVGGPVRVGAVELRVRAHATQVLIDLDLEARLTRRP